MVRAGDDVVAVAGAGGRLGSRLAIRLAAEGAHQRLIVRSAAQAPRLPDGAALPDADTVVVTSYGDAPGMRGALAGVRVLFLVSAREAADRVAQHVAVVDAAAACGVERVVYTSLLGADAEAVSPLARDHFATEQHLRRSGLRWTFLRTNLYHQMLTAAVDPDGIIRGPAGSGRVASVSHDDVADVATAVLLDERLHAHDARIYEITGPTAITLDEAAATLAEFTGRPIRYEPVPAPTQADGVRHGQPEGWSAACAAIATGDLGVVHDDVARLVGRAARSFGQWLDDYPDQWEHLRR